MTRYSFDAFVFDTDTWCLSKDDETHDLRPKTAAVLAYLLDNHHRICTKDEIMAAVWGDVVVSENTLMQGIQELRKLLGDNARNPDFVKTWPRRGYQWIFHPVMLDPDPREPSSTPGPTPDPPVPPVESDRPRRRWLGPALVGVAVLLLPVFFLSPARHPSTAPSPPPGSATLALSPFVNETGDPSLDWIEQGLPDLLADELSRNGLPVVHLRNRQPASFLETEPLDRLSARLESSQGAYVIHWQRSYDGTQVQQYRSNLDRPLDAVAEIVKRLHLPTGHRGSQVPRAETAYADGIRALATSGAATARVHFERASTADPHFVRAKIMLAFCMDILGDIEGSRTSLRKALPLASEDPLARLAIHRNLGLIALNQMELHAATQHLSHARDEAEALGIRAPETVKQLAMARFLAGERQLSPTVDPDETVEALMDVTQSRLRISSLLGLPGETRHLNAELAWYRELGDRHNEAVTLLQLANRDDISLAEKRRLLNGALDLFAEVGYRKGTARTLTDLGYLCLLQGQTQMAGEHLDHATALYRNLGDPLGEAKALFYLGLNTLLGHLHGDYDGLHLAHRRLSESLAIYRRHRLEIRLVTVNHIGLGMIERERRQPDEAEHRFERALQLGTDLDVPEDRWMALICLMVLDMDRGDYELALTRRETTTPAPALHHVYRARCFYQLGQFEKAMEQLAFARSIEGDRWRPAEENFWYACEEALKTGRAQELQPLKHPLLVYLETRNRQVLSQ
ncbi:Winged helix-turn-helix domain-containing protein [Sulfidibacter corallicola]|uniref:Winged helix-turn-helix domain-containing protein n=1 Tax=Sulfidibacter corallicola TaxID=2818388 RepID=A0A8A4TQP7_SULCO|nr:winged helix-turn-helix domain-containing protein [Sulfidibacter corallicola]QTD51880.1 winged helix-turn-helix domain-containing protein [Sulfidibacter corallicola]